MANTKVTTRVIADDAITSDKLASGLTLGGDTTLSGHLDLADDKNIQLGASGDLRLFHQNSSSLNYIQSFTSGELRLESNGNTTIRTNNGDDMAVFTKNGAVTLYHDDSAKIATASGGVTITGTATATTFAGELSGTITSATTGTTQSASDNSTKLATTAYVTTAISNLVDSSPSALNTLNELAAALGDDANFSTTVTNSIATKLPLAGGTMTGALNMGSQNITNAGTIASGAITADGNITADYNDTISLNYSVANGDYHKGMSGTSFASGNTARGLHLFNFDNDSNFGINFWVGTTASKVFAARIDYAGNLGLGNDSPTNYYSTFRNLVIGSSGSNGITVVSGTTGAGTVAFADGTSGDAQYRGYIQYNHNGDSLALGSAGGDRVTIDSSGNTTFTGNITFGDGHTIGNDGSDNLTIASSTSEHIILDSAQDIVLDADNADIFFKDGGTTFMTANSANGLIIGTGEVNESIRLDHYSAAQSDITGLVAGSTFGSIIYGGTNGHIVMALRDNDVADSFSVISGSGNYMTDTTFDKKVFSVKADGKTEVNGLFGVGVTPPGTTQVDMVAGGVANHVLQLRGTSNGSDDTTLTKGLRSVTANANNWAGLQMSASYLRFSHQDSSSDFEVHPSGVYISDNGQQGDFAYHTKAGYSYGGAATSYSSSYSAAQTVSTASLSADGGFKTVAIVNTRAYTSYVNIKTNLTGNNIMFLAHFLGYMYGYGNKEALCGGYTYNSGGTLTVLSKANTSVHTGSGGFTVDSYRASDGALCFKLYVNHQGYTEGYAMMRFHSHSAATTRQCTIAAVQIRNDGTNHFA